MLHIRTTTLDAVFLLSPLTVFGNRNLMITITPTPFEIYISLKVTCSYFAECTVRISGVLYF